MDLVKIETELKKRWQIPYQWKVKQQNNYDKYTNFIYQIQSWDRLHRTLDIQFQNHPEKDFYFNYAINRWYNFWSARAVEYIFQKNENVKVEGLSEIDLEIDFYLNDIPFDHKTSVFPRKCQITLAQAQEKPEELMEWLYQNQSVGRRHHFKNRLFLVLFEQNQEHWKLKAEIQWLKTIIDNYLESFDNHQLHLFLFEKNQITHADIIWAIQP